MSASTLDRAGDRYARQTSPIARDCGFSIVIGMSVSCCTRRHSHRLLAKTRIPDAQTNGSPARGNPPIHLGLAIKAGAEIEGIAHCRECCEESTWHYPYPARNGWQSATSHAAVISAPALFQPDCRDWRDTGKRPTRSRAGSIAILATKLTLPRPQKMLQEREDRSHA